MSILRPKTKDTPVKIDISQQNKILRMIQAEQSKTKPTSKTKGQAISRKPPAPPCMASRQWHEAIRAENLKTVEGRAIEYNKDHYHELKMPKDW